MNKNILFAYEEVEDWLTENESLWDWGENEEIILHSDKAPTIVRKVIEKYNRS